MKLIRFSLYLLIILSFDVCAGTLCFSPVIERDGDKSTERSFWQSFDYKVQVDNGPVVKPNDKESTPYSYGSKIPVVKIWLGDEVIESFTVKPEWIEEGRSCIYFYNIYETWSVVESWQAKKLCSCKANKI